MWKLQNIITIIAFTAILAVFVSHVQKVPDNNNKSSSSSSSEIDFQSQLLNDGAGGGGASWPSMSQEDCTDKYGGSMVGDIGDGAIHRSSYRCESNGQVPIGTIVFDSSNSNMIPVEGMVCCGPS